MVTRCPQLTYEQFEELLDNFGRSSPVCIQTITDPAMNTGGRKDKETGKYPNPYIDENKNCLIEKVARRTGFIGVSYESCVQRQRDRENQPLDRDGNVETFRAEEMWYGKGRHVSKYIVEHIETGERYFCFKPPAMESCKVGGTHEAVYRWKHNGEEIPYLKVRVWLKEDGPSKRQETDKPIYWQVYHLSSLHSIRLSGEYYELRHPVRQVS